MSEKYINNDFYSYLKLNYEIHSNWQIKKFATKVKEVCSLLTGIPVEDFEKEEVKSSTLGEEWKQCFYMSSNENKILLDTPYPKEDTLYKYHNLTVRELLQKVGTDAMRDVIHPDVWVNALMKDYRSIVHLKDNAPFSCHHDLTPEFKEKYIKFIEYPNWLVTDVRFPNEIKAVKDRQGIVIRVNRPCSTCHTYDNKFCSNGYHSNNHISETSLDTYNFDYVIENDSDIPSLIEKVKEMLIHFKLL